MLTTLFIGFFLAVGLSLAFFVILDLQADKRTLGAIFSVVAGVLSAIVLTNVMTGKW